MKWHRIFCLSVFCFIATNQSAQEASIPFVENDIVTQWDEAEQSIVLLRNKDDILPLKKLGNLNVSWSTLGLEEQNEFETTLAKYTTNNRRPGPKEDIHITAFSTAEYSPVNPDFTNYLRGLKERLRRFKTILVIVGNPEIISLIPDINLAHALIIVPVEGNYSLSLSAQLIFGGIGANGTLSHDIGDLFKRGEGLKTSGHLRLRYSPPELAGFDEQLLYDSMKAIVEEGIKAHGYPGAQVLIAKDGLVVFHETYGFHTYDSLQPVQLTDVYDFASITKVTSTLPALMKFYGEDKFDLDAPLKKYFPYFKKTEKGEVSYREFLSHFGKLKPGIVFWRTAQEKQGEWKKRSFKDHYSRRYPIKITDSLFLFKNYKKQIYKGIKDLPLNKERSYVYSDLSFVLYPFVVEKLADEKLEHYLKKTFYEPLGAFTLSYNPLQHFPVGQIIPTEQDTFFRKIQVHGTVHDETAAMLNGISGHAGLFGSANDLAKIFQMYLDGGAYGGEQLIQESALKEFTRCQYCEQGNRRGLGFDKPLIRFRSSESYVAKSASPASFGHSGFTGTFVWADPEQNLLFIFMSNRVYPDRSSRSLYDLNIRQRLHQAVYDAIRKDR